VVGDFNEWTHGLASRLMVEAFEAAHPRRRLWFPRTYPGSSPSFTSTISITIATSV
jgi:hypothetical protein